MKIQSLRKIGLVVVVGIGAGILSVLYRLLLNRLFPIRQMLFSNTSISWILTLVIIFSVMSLIAGYLVKKVPLSSGSGIPQIQGELQEKIDAPPIRVILSKLIGGGLNNLVGLSLGREGPSIQIGSMFGKWISQVFHQEEDKEILMTAGASAGLAAAFNAPLSGIIFAMEELHKSMAVFIIIPCLISTACADYLSKQFFGLDTSFGFMNLSEPIALNLYIYLIGLGCITGIGGWLFNQVILRGQDIHQRIPLPFRLLPSYMLSLVLGFFLMDVLGGGHHLLHEMILHPYTLGSLICILVVKYIFTGISYGSSAQGGIFLPLLCIGGLWGNIYGMILVHFGLLAKEDIKLMMMFAMVGILTSVLRSPTLGIILVFELTGGGMNILGIMIVALIAYLISGMISKESIYEVLLDRLLKSSKVSSR